MVFLFALTLFVSAALLFLVQPMVGRMVLPIMGGTPAVWNTCMVFFQAALLAGYAYSHVSVTLLGARKQAILHLLVLLVPLLVLPIAIGSNVLPPAVDNPAPWLLWQLLLFVGAPFFVVSTTSPLLQRWFAQTGHRDAKDPYYLYAISNMGSLLALLGYPLLLEPVLSIPQQAQIWTYGYFALVVLIGCCALTLIRKQSSSISESVMSEVAVLDAASKAPTWGDRAWWVLLACVPSSLMLGVTSYITTDLAAIPLFWVLPLALYLLTTIFAFARKPMSLRNLSLLTPAVLPLWLFTLAPIPVWATILCHLFIFFLLALMCHSRLAASRPPAKYLTEFYLWLSVGGLVGGFFNALVAPLIFNYVIEYHLMLAVACMLKPPAERESTPLERRLDFVAPAILLLATMGIILLIRSLKIESPYPARVVAFLLIPAACFVFRNRPVRFGLGVACLLAVAVFLRETESRVVSQHRERNFYGVKHVRENEEKTYRELIHGGISHGLQSTDPVLALEPFGYSHRSSPVGDAFSVLQDMFASGHFAIIGLGTGAMAAYVRPGDRMTFYEIDPGVARLAKDYFTYLDQCKGKYDIELGDGRLTMARAPANGYSMIMIDAFSSDSIPIHLICREALQLYLSKLADGGLVVFHLSNLYMTLEPVVANLANDAGLAAKVRYHRVSPDSAKKKGIFPSCYLVVARKSEDLAKFEAKNWTPAAVDSSKGIWTDQYCNVLSVVRWKKD